MSIFLIALGFLAATAGISACLSLVPHMPAAVRVANGIGPLGILLGCLVGLCAVVSGPWETAQSCTLPWDCPSAAAAWAWTR